MPRLELTTDEHVDPETETRTACTDATSAAQVDLETPTHRGDVAAALLCLAGALLGYFIVVPAAVYVPSRFAGTVNSPAFFPNLLLIILAGLSALYLASSLAALKREPPQGWTPRSEWALAGGTALLCVGYVAAIYLVGLTLASALCVAATIYYFGERRLWVIVPTSLVLPALLWLFFVKVANVLFPTPLFPVMEVFLSAAEGRGAIGRVLALAVFTG